jgi:transposase
MDGAAVESYSFDVGLFHSLLSCRLSGAFRKTSYGTQTDHGNRAVERLLTIRETCRLQHRRLHTYLTNAITAHQHGQPVPAPLRA